MTAKWIQVWMYVVLNVPVPTHKDLWQPARPGQKFHRPMSLLDNRTSAGRGFGMGIPEPTTDRRHFWVDLKEPGNSVTTDELGSHPEGSTVLGGAKQHLADGRGVDPNSPTLPGDRNHFWVDLNEPSMHPTMGQIGSHPQATNAVPSAKQRLSAAHMSGGSVSADKHNYEYHYRFVGQVLLNGKPCANATVVLRLAAPDINMEQKVTTHADGRYQFNAAFDGENNESVMWWLQGNNGDAAPREFEGSRILSHQNPRVSVEKDIPLE